MINHTGYEAVVLCESSGEIRRRLRAMGINAVSVDILKADDGEEEHHIQGDAAEYAQLPWGLVIAHPPCTYLANSGVRWLYKNAGCTGLVFDQARLDKMRQGAAFFHSMLEANSPLIAVENPVMHFHAKAEIGRGHTFTMQPYEHGEPVTKRTCWWTVGLPDIKPTRICSRDEIAAAKLSGYFDAIHKAPPGPNRWKVRSKTFPGIAQAVADAWGGHYLSTKGLTHV